MQPKVEPIYVEVESSESLGITVTVGRFIGEENHHIYTSKSFPDSGGRYKEISSTINHLTGKVESETKQYLESLAEPVDYAVSPIMQYFTFAHLPEHLQKVSKPIGELATRMDILLPNGAEKSAGLRKLLEAKDCLVRASLPVKG
jgi:hypothetical protein